MVSAATMFRKSGFNDSDAAMLAKVAAQYQNVADTAVTAEEAAASIVSQIRAFGEDASFATKVIDAYNEVANRFSVGTNDLSNAMEIASSGMATYGNTFQQIIGLVTSGVEIMTGRSAQVARGLATIAARIVKNQDALAEYGIQVEKTDGSLKSTYDILAELKPKWDSMTDAQRVALGDTIAGQNQYKVLASVMQNFQHAIDATEVALNSSGSAIKENERYMESLEAKEQAVAAEFEDFANRVLSKEVVGGFLDAKQAALEFINTDFGAAVTRIVGVGTAAASVAGIIGTMGAKLALVAKQLQAAGAATGVLGVLTSPKSLLIIGAVAAAIGLVVESARYLSEIDTRKLEGLNNQLQETNDKISEMSGPGSEYDTLIQNVDKLTEADKRRLVVLESQLENLRQQKSEQESAYLAEWQRQQTEKKAETVLVQPDVNDPQGFEHTEIIEYTEATRATDELRDAFERLNNQRRAGILSQEQYVAGMQDLIDGSAETYNNLKALEGANIALTDEQRAFLGIYNSVQQQVNNVATSMTNAANGTEEFGDAVDDAASNASPFTSMLFDATGQLTEYGRQAVQSSSALADLAVKELQASQAAAQANFSNLIAQIQSVANNALIAGQQLATMMSMAGVDFGTGDPDQFFKMRYRQTMGETAESNIAGYNKFVTDYLASRATENFQSTMDNIKGQIDQLNQYTSTSVGGSAAKTAKNVENTAKRATDNIANYAKEQAEAVSQEIEDMFSKLRDTEEDYWDAKIDALEEQNKEIDRQVQLEEKLKALEEAKNQKVLLYKDGRFQYDTNRAAVASAQYDLNKTWIDVSLDKQKDILTKMKNGALDLIDEWKEKALEQGELTAEDINTLLGEYHDLGNAQYETVAWGTAGISNLIGTGMSVIGNAIAKSKLGQQLGLGNLNQQLANSGAFSGLYTGSDLRSGGTSGATGTGGSLSLGSFGGGASSGTTGRTKGTSGSTSGLSSLLNPSFGTGLSATGVKSSRKVSSENSWANRRNRTPMALWLAGESRENPFAGRYNQPSYQLDRFNETSSFTDAYRRDAAQYGADVAWWIQQMTRTTSDTLTKEEREAFNAWAGLPEGSTFLFPSDYGETQQSLLTTDWGTRAANASSAAEFQDYLARGIAKIKVLDLDIDIDRWIEQVARAAFKKNPALLGIDMEHPDSPYGYRKELTRKRSSDILEYGGADWTTQLGYNQMQFYYGELNPNDINDVEDYVVHYWMGDVHQSDTATREMLQRMKREEPEQYANVINRYQQQLIGIKDAMDAFDEFGQMTEDQYNGLRMGTQGTGEGNRFSWSDSAHDAITGGGRDAILAQIKKNSQDWFDADETEKSRLHEENEHLRALLDSSNQFVESPYAYARGTTHARGGLSLVGEDGPEIRVLGRGDGIIPSDVTNNLWKFGQNPHMFMRSYGQSLSNTFNISNLTLPNVHDAQSLVSGLERMAHQYVAQRS